MFTLLPRLIGALLVLSPAAAVAEDIAAGRNLYKRCATCHSDSDENRLGPSLVSVVGRPAGTAAGFTYSQTVKNAGSKGLVWSREALDRYLENPTRFYGSMSKCITPSVRKGEDRQHLIAYLVELPKVAATNAKEREERRQENIRRAKLAEQERAMKIYAEQVLRAAEAVAMGAGPGALDLGGYVRPRLLRMAYEGQFEGLVPDDFPAEYYYRFAETVSGRCPNSGMDTARLRYGTDLLQRGFDKDFQEEVLQHMFKVLPQIFRNPESLMAQAMKKEAALKAGPQDAGRFVERHGCESNSGIAKRMYANVGAVLAGDPPIYVNSPRKPDAIP